MLRNFAKFAGKHLCQSLYFNKVAGPGFEKPQQLVSNICDNGLISKIHLQVHYVKSVRIRSFSGPYFPAFGLNTDIYSVYLHISPYLAGMWGNMDQKNSKIKNTKITDQKVIGTLPIFRRFINFDIQQLLKTYS